MHTYSDLAAFSRFMGDPDPQYEADVLLPFLEDASRAVEDYCERSRFGSGFGPRIGVNYYQGEDTGCLWLDDDVLEVTSMAVTITRGGASTTYVENTDFLLVPYSRTPKRRLDALETSGMVLGSLQKGIALTVKAGYQDVRRTATSQLNGALNNSATSVPVDDGDEFSPGQTLLVDSEQLYVRSITGDSLTVDRGANGTTAASHLDNAPIGVYLYPSRVVFATNFIAQRLMNAGATNSDGSFGGSEMPPQQYSVSERAILRARLGRLRCVVAANGHLAEVGATAA